MKTLWNKTSSFVMRNKSSILFMMCLAALASTPMAHASTSSSSLPWETPLKTVSDSLTGPVALSISVCALFACGATLVFGGEMTEFVKRALYAVMAIAFIVGGSSVMSSVFGVSGSLISDANSTAIFILPLAERVSQAAVSVAGTILAVVV